MNTNKKNSYPLLPYGTVLAATQGDPEAMAAVLRHFKGYIAKLSCRYLYDECGNAYLCVDETLRARLEAKLMFSMLAFDAA